MRFELYLTKLPALGPEEIKAKLGNLPGLSAGVLKKALETKSLPTIAVGWSEGRAEAEQVARRLGALGGACRVVDHAPLWVKVGTSIEELCASAYDGVKELVAPRARASAPANKSKKLLALPPHVEKAIQATLVFLLKWALAGGIYALSAVSDGGSTSQAVAIDGLVIEVLVVAVGLLCAQVLSNAVTGLMNSQIAIKIAVPMLIVPVVVVSTAAVNVQTTVVTEAPVVKPKAVAAAPLTYAKNQAKSVPPRPSRPYQGLVEELRLRKLRHSEAVFDEVRVTDAAPGELPAGMPAAAAAASVTPTAQSAEKPAPQSVASVAAPQAAAITPAAATEPVTPVAETQATEAPQAAQAPAEPTAPTATAPPVQAAALVPAPEEAKATPQPKAPAPSPARIAPRADGFAPTTDATELWLLALAIVIGARALERTRDRRKLAELTTDQARARDEQSAATAAAHAEHEQALEAVRAQLAEAEREKAVLTRDLDAVRDALERANKRAAEAAQAKREAPAPAAAAKPAKPAARAAIAELPTVPDDEPADEHDDSDAESERADSARPAAEQPAKDHPAGAARVASPARRSGHQKKGAAYAAFDIKEERVSLGKRDKR